MAINDHCPLLKKDLLIRRKSLNLHPLKLINFYSFPNYKDN